MKMDNKELLSRLLFLFDSGAVRRGLDYYHKGFVASCDVNYAGEDILIHSEVLGTYRYIQMIIIDSERFGIDSRCGCPVGGDCKHVVAALFKAFSMPIKKPVPKKDFEIWLEKISDNDSTDTDIRLDKEYFLLYRLFTVGKGGEISFYKSKILKNGKISKGVKVSNENLFYTYKYSKDYLSQTDMDIIPLLDNLSTERF